MLSVQCERADKSLYGVGKKRLYETMKVFKKYGKQQSGWKVFGSVQTAG